MTDLNTYLQEIKSKLRELENIYSNLEIQQVETKEKHLAEIKNILRQIQEEYARYELDETASYPLTLENFIIGDADIEEALNKLFKLV